MNKKLNNLFKGDKVIWMIFFFLCLVSIIEVFSASSFLTFKGGSYWGPLIKHTSFILFGLGAMICVLNIPCKYFKIVTFPLLLISLIMILDCLTKHHLTEDGGLEEDITGFSVPFLIPDCLISVRIMPLDGVQRFKDIGEIESAHIVGVSIFDVPSGLDVFPDAVLIIGLGLIPGFWILHVPVTDGGETVGDEITHGLILVSGIRKVRVDGVKQFFVRFHLLIFFDFLNIHPTEGVTVVVRPVQSDHIGDGEGMTLKSLG